MANTQGREPSSVFDDMLAQSKRRLDELYDRGRRIGGGPLPAAGATPGRERTPPQSPAPLPGLDPDSAAARRLNERFGKDWRYEVVEQKRDGNEAIALCKLFLGKEGAVRTQFGRAKISQGPVLGTSGDVRFRLDTGRAEQDERDAFRLAVEAALMNCIDLA
jgi:hypothetical protein